MTGRDITPCRECKDAKTFDSGATISYVCPVGNRYRTPADLCDLVRCGACDVRMKPEDWDKHLKTPEHRTHLKITENLEKATEKL